MPLSKQTSASSISRHSRNWTLSDAPPSIGSPKSSPRHPTSWLKSPDGSTETQPSFSKSNSEDNESSADTSASKAGAAKARISARGVPPIPRQQDLAPVEFHMHAHARGVRGLRPQMCFHAFIDGIVIKLEKISQRREPERPRRDIYLFKGRRVRAVAFRLFVSSSSSALNAPKAWGEPSSVRSILRLNAGAYPWPTKRIR